MNARILVVDDDRTNRLVAKSTLESKSYQVEEACDGIEAISMLGLDNPSDSLSYDLVLLDIMMPVIDGIEVLKRIRRQWTNIQLPVIMATANDKDSDIVEALSAGANDYVTKPINISVMMARIEVHCAMKENHETLQKAQNSLVNAARMEAHALLAAGMAHEIRNPLGRIQMAIGIVQQFFGDLNSESQEMATEVVNTIESSVKRADEIVKQIMQVSSEQQLELTATDLNEEVTAGLSKFTSKIEAGEILLTKELDESIPPALVSSPEFQEAFSAIVENAIQALNNSQSPMRNLTVRTREIKVEGVPPNEGDRAGKRMRNGESAILLQIEDTGPGMTETAIEKAFDAFFTTKATGTGTGLGLTVAHKLVELHYGLIRIENRTDVPSGLRVNIYFKKGMLLGGFIKTGN